MKILRLLSCLFALSVSVSYARETQLPQAAVEVQPKQEEVLIYVRPWEGTGAAHADDVVICFNGRDYTLEEFSRDAHLHMNITSSVCLYVAEAVPWGRFVQVLECCTNAGVQQVRFKKSQTKQTNEEQAPELLIP